MTAATVPARPAVPLASVTCGEHNALNSFGVEVNGRLFMGNK